MSDYELSPKVVAHCQTEIIQHICQYVGIPIPPAICDGFASVHDPNGIDRQELVRLAKGRLSLKHFDTSKLSPNGFHVGVNEKNKTLPDGSVVADGTAFRNRFHFTPYADADVMVPCGGRPSSVTLATVHLMLRNASGVTLQTLGRGEGTQAGR